MTEVKILVPCYTTQSQAQNCASGADSANNSYASDIKKLKQSRKKVLKFADFIIPGHAGMCKVKKP